MEPSYWGRLAHFIKESYTQRIRQAGSGILMGFVGAQHLLFSGVMADLVGPVWWIIKGVGTIMLAFFTSLATSYAAYLIDVYKENQKKRPVGQKKRKDKAA